MENQELLKRIDSHLKSINGWVTFMGIVMLFGIIASLILGVIYYLAAA